MSNWLHPLKRIFDADTGDLRKLAEAVGGNPEIFYIGRDLSNCDLRGQDLRGMDLTGATLNPDHMDAETKIDPQFDPRFVFTSHYIQIAMREEVLAMALAFADVSHYTYKAWAMKALLEWGIKNITNKEVQHVIDVNPELKDLYFGKGKMRRLTVLVYPFIQESAHQIALSDEKPSSREVYNKILIAALVRQFLTRNRVGNYASVSPMEMFKGTDSYLREIRRGKRFMR